MREKKNRRGIPWTRIETEYVAGTMSLKDLAKRKRISYSTLSKRASEGGWAGKRKDFRAGVEERALVQARERGVQRLNELMLGTEKLLDEAMRALGDQLQFQRYVVSEGAGPGVSETVEKTFDKRDTRAMKDMAAVIRELSGLLRDHYGIYTPAQELSQELVREKIRQAKETMESGQQTLQVRWAEENEDERSGDPTAE